MGEAPLIVFDADGVLLDETPFWRAAILAALAGAAPAVPAGRREAFAMAAIDLGLPSVTKERGCNSNWDFAAVLATALANGVAHEELAAGEWRTAIAHLAQAMRAMAVFAKEAEPLARFGLRRDGAVWRTLVPKCESALVEIVARDGWPVLGSVPRLATTLASLRAAGCVLGICTGRRSDDLWAALHSHSLADFFAPEAVVDADRVAADRALHGPVCGDKPHAFPLLAAACGTETAIAMLRFVAAPKRLRPVVFAGDGRADLETARAARAVGLPVRYAHIVSPASDATTLAAVAAMPASLGVFANVQDFAMAWFGRGA